MKNEYNDTCDELETAFCDMIVEESPSGDWSFGDLLNFGKGNGYDEKTIYMVASNLACHDIPKKFKERFQ